MLIEKQYLTNFQVALASFLSTDVAPSSAISSVVCFAQETERLTRRDETEIVYVITTSMIHKNAMRWNIC